MIKFYRHPLKFLCHIHLVMALLHMHLVTFIKQNSNFVAILSLDDSELILHGSEKVISTYKDSVKKVSFDGASWFAPLIEETTNLAKINLKNFKVYTIVLIITCGKISDHLQTFEALNKDSLATVSFIFINIGPENQAECIDADDKPLTGKKSVQPRDFVDYIFYKDVVDKNLSPEHKMKKENPIHVVNLNNIKSDFFSS